MLVVLMQTICHSIKKSLLLVIENILKYRILSKLNIFFCSGVSGAFGGFVGTPGDLVNVRMQNDVKLPIDQRRKCVIDIFFPSFFMLNKFYLPLSILQLQTRNRWSGACLS